MAKNHGGINANDFADLIFKQMKAAKDGAEPYAKDAGEQVGESFADGIEQGFENAANRIAASSLKINKAFKDLAKRLTNQKDIFNISLGGKNVALDIDFSDIDINSADFQKKIDEAFEKIKIDNAIEFDSKAVEKQFKNMLGLYVKYSDKLYQLQNQSTKLTNPDSMKHNVQEQMAMINGLKEIQRILDQTSGMSISLPHVSSSSEKDLRTIIETIDRVYDGEKRVGKQRDTNAAKLKKENKELKERNKILEEKVGPIEGEQAPPARKPRAKKQKQSVEKQTNSRKKSTEPEIYETDSGQMSILPSVEEEIKAKDKLAESNDKVAKSQKKVKEAAQGTQMTMDDFIPHSAEDTVPKVEEESKARDKVGKSAGKASKSKKDFAKANKEVAASVTPSVKGLKIEADAMEDIGDAAKNTTKVVSEEAKRAAEDMSFSTRDYEKLYTEMEAFAAQRKAENGYDLSRVSVNTDAHGNPLGATISYYKKATKETITETFKIDQAAQEAGDGVDRLVLSSRKATAGIADFEKATLGAINKQNTLAINTERTVNTMSAALDANANRNLVGKDGENEVREKLEAIRTEAEKLKQDPNGILEPLSEREFLASKKRIAELINETRVLITTKKNAAWGETLESNAVDAGTYRKDNLKAQINEWKLAGIYVGDLQNKGEALLKVVDTITDHAGLKKYLIGVKEAGALAKLAIQDKKAEEARQKALNAEYKEYIKLIEKRDAIEAKMIGLDPEKNKDELAALRADYDAVDNEWNSKYGNFLEREDVQNHFTIDELSYADDAARRKMAIKEGKISDKKRLEEEASAQKKINEAYAEYIRLVQERGRASVKLAGLDPDKNKAEIDNLTTYIDGIDDKLNETYGGLLSNHIAQATLTLEDFMKYYDKWQQKLADKEAKAADKARNKEEKPYRDYGKTTANSAVRKRDNIQGEIDALGVTNPKILAQMDDYKAKVQEIVDIRAQFAGDPKAAQDPELVKQFQKASAEAERTRRSIKAVIDEEQKMMQMSSEQGFDPIELTSDQLTNLKDEMIAFAQANANGRVEIKGFNDDNTKMYYTVTDSKGSVQEMTTALGQGTNQLYKYRTATKETGTLVQQIFKGIKVKAKELLSFVIGGGSVYKVIELLRQGIQYVREIDLALTELKKVTDETEESYDKFLETAAKTADKVGSTIQKVVSSTADWARLGSVLAKTSIRPII